MKLHPIASDARYTITREHCGHAKPRFVLRWCDEWIDSFASYPAAVLRASCHRCQRLGALVITEQPATP